MKKTILLFLFLFMVPVAFAFQGSSSNYQTMANIGLGAVLEQSSANYNIFGEMINQPIGLFDSVNFETKLGPFYLWGIEAVTDTDRDGDGVFDSEDNCPDDYNPDQEDLDEDGLGDICDPEPAVPIPEFTTIGIIAILAGTLMVGLFRRRK